MKQQQKLSVLLALCQDRAAKWAAMLKDYSKFFNSNQGAFQGRLHTYQPKDEAQDDESLRKNDTVLTSPTEKLDYLIDFNNQFWKDILTKERTNGTGAAKGILKYGNIEVEMTANELLALKNLVGTAIKDLISSIPTRPENQNWIKTSGKYAFEVYATEPVSFKKRSVLKEPYILIDDNLSKLKDTSSYKPQVATKDTPIILGEGTRQEFHSGWTQFEKEEALSRYNDLQDAITTALHEANDTEVVPTNLDTKELFTYLFYGK